MSIPSILFGVLLSTLYGAAFHLWRGGGLGRLVLYLVLGWIGFWAGQFIASRLGWTFASLGPLHLCMATITSFIFLGIGYWLSLVEVERQ
jgi:uncharacterized membrane protein YeaQ/YmgE (transglycosylase-associated protein family)